MAKLILCTISLMKRNITAKTFTPLYDEVEDRLRVVINYEDMQNRVDFMITRNFILNLIPSAEEFVIKHYGAEPLSHDSIAIGSEKERSGDESLSKSTQESADNEVLSKTDTVNLELLRTQEELLLEMNLSFDKDTKQTLLALSSKDTAAKITLDQMMLQKIIHVIKSAIPFMKWGISRHF